MIDPKLETFKSGIDLQAYAAALGYIWDRKESWRGSTAMHSRTAARSSSSAMLTGALCVLGASG